MKPKAGCLKSEEVKWGSSLHTFFFVGGAVDREMSKEHALTLGSVLTLVSLLISLDKNVLISQIFASLTS